MSKHQLKLADRQCRMSELSQRVQDTIVMIVTALWGGQQKNEVAAGAADILCQDLRRKLTGERPSDQYFRDVTELADKIIAGGFDDLAGAAAGGYHDAVRREWSDLSSRARRIPCRRGAQRRAAKR